MKRRERGDGSVGYDTDRSRWVGRLDLGSGPDGRRIRLKVTGKTRIEARTRLDELRRKHHAGQDLTARTITFEALALVWLERGLPTSTSETTRENYRSLITKHLLPTLGHKKVAELRPEAIEAVLDAMAAAGYSGRTMALVLNLAQRVFAYGEKRSVVLRNAASPVNAPRGPHKQRYGLTVDQARGILQAADGERLGPLITVSLLLGLRPGEAAALTWDALVLDGPVPTLKVDASLRRTPDGMVIADPKTPTSRRTLALPHAAVSALQRQRVQQAAEREKADAAWANSLNLVFATERGTPLDPSNVRRALRRIANRAGLEHLHPHLLRHATASLLSAAGVPLEDISDTLGYRSVSVTAQVYRHPITPIRTGHHAAMTALAERVPATAQPKLSGN